MDSYLLENFQNKLDKFFLLYSRFLTLDVFSSLSKNGRSHQLIGLFLNAFIDVINDKLKTIQNIESLAKAIITYNKACEEDLFHDCKHKTCQQHPLFSAKISQKLTNSFIKFADAAELYHLHRKLLHQEEIIKIYIKSNLNYQRSYFFKPFDEFEKFIQEASSKNEIIHIAFLKQSLIEFNNALSHLNNAYWGRYPDQNISRAANHLERGALDFYKAIIRDRSFLELLDKDIITQINEIRCLEYSQVGAEVRENIFTSYKTVLKNYLNKF